MMFSLPMPPDGVTGVSQPCKGGIMAIIQVTIDEVAQAWPPIRDASSGPEFNSGTASIFIGGAQTDFCVPLPFRLKGKN